MFFFLFKDTDN